MQDGARVESSLLPEPFHRGAAEGIIFPGALGLDWVVDKLDDIHFGKPSIGIVSTFGDLEALMTDMKTQAPASLFPRIRESWFSEESR
jgi:hypothetical protein